MSRITSIARPNDETVDRKTSKLDRCLTVHYQHEQRLAAFKKDVHQLWAETLKGTHIQDIRLIVGNRNNRNTKRELIHNRPTSRGMR